MRVIHGMNLFPVICGPDGAGPSGKDEQCPGVCSGVLYGKKGGRAFSATFLKHRFFLPSWYSIMMTHPARLYLNKGVRHRILAGHPWVFATEVGRVDGTAEDSGTVEIRSGRGDFLGSGIYNSRSPIVSRCYAH